MIVVCRGSKWLWRHPIPNITGTNLADSALEDLADAAVDSTADQNAVIFAAAIEEDEPLVQLEEVKTANGEEDEDAIFKM